MVLVILLLVLLIGAFHGRMLPEPELQSPIAVLELDHEKVAPVGELVKAGMEIKAPGHTMILDI